jgi:hypothetical protein
MELDSLKGNRMYRCKYEYNPSAPFGAQHIWSVLAAQAGLHLWIRETPESKDQPVYGGLEIHWRQPPDYMADDAPSQDHCWLLKAPCWHDGSSLQAEQKWIPKWRANPHDHSGMFSALTETLKALESSKSDS